MKCADCKKRLSSFLDGEIPQAGLSALEEHMSACEECRRLYARMTVLDESLRSLHAPVPHSDLSSKVKAELFSDKRSLWECVPLSVRRTIPVLIVILMLAIGLGTMAGRSLTNLLLDRQPRAKAEFVVLDMGNSLADTVLDLGSRETSR
jgi:anti-sigma factor RsiW